MSGCPEIINENWPPPVVELRAYWKAHGFTAPSWFWTSLNNFIASSLPLYGEFTLEEGVTVYTPLNVDDSPKYAGMRLIMGIQEGRVLSEGYGVTLNATTGAFTFTEAPQEGQRFQFQYTAVKTIT